MKTWPPHALALRSTLIWSIALLLCGAAEQRAGPARPPPESHRQTAPADPRPRPAPDRAPGRPQRDPIPVRRQPRPSEPAPPDSRLPGARGPQPGTPGPGPAGGDWPGLSWKSGPQGTSPRPRPVSSAERTPSGELYSWRAPGRYDLRSPQRADRPPAPTGGHRTSSEEALESKLARARGALDRADSLQTEGDYAGAVAQGELARGLLEDVPSTERLLRARCLSLLGGLSWLRGDYASAEPLLLRALAVYAEGVVTSHPDVAALLNKLAIVYQAQGLYGRAEPLHRRALAIQETVLGKAHPEVAASLNNLAILYRAQGLYTLAESFHQRALDMRQAALGPGHADVAGSLINLAEVYKAQGMHSRAEPLVQRALRIQEQVLGEGHPDVARSLVNLAELHGAQGQYAKAEPSLRRAIGIQEEVLGPKHPDLAGSLSVLATLRREQGMASQAEQLAQEALEIREKALGQYHPDVAASLCDVAFARVAQRRLDEAVPLLARALLLREQRLRREALDFSEARLAGFLALLRASEEQIYALSRAHPDHAGLRRLALTAALLWKGRSVQETANTSRAVYRSLGPEDRTTFARLRELRSELARLSFEGPGPLSHADYQEQVERLVAQGDALETTLARRSARLRALVELPAPTDIVDRAAAALSPDSALVELIAYADHPPSGTAGLPAPRPPAQLRYLALVLLTGAEIRAVDLGPAQPIDAATARLRDALASTAAGYQQEARALCARVFEPLRPLLGARRSIHLSTDGQLSLVPFAALHDGRGFIGSTYSFTYLTSGKDLLPRTFETPASPSVVVFADPAFDAQPGEMVASADDRALAQLRRSYSTVPLAPAGPPDVSRGGWVRLPGTRREAEALRRLFPRAQVFLDQDATKDRLLHVRSPGILHVATHGFFREDAAPAPGTRAFDFVGPVSGSLPPLAEGSDPLLKSGLVLAGAQAPGAGGKAADPDLDRTLVTALELAGLDLWGTQLVVLSACDTGRGDVKLGQGVYGLRRALAVAGAETVVMSLWKVNDDTTQALMEAYYRNLLDGKTRATALREAMQTIQLKQPHPHYWAPFISVGRDTRLQAPVGG